VWGNSARALALRRAVLIVGAGAALAAGFELVHAAKPAAIHKPLFGVYAGPGAAGVTGAATFAAQTGSTPAHVLDFADTDTWSNMTGPNWLLEPHAASTSRLEYSLPLLPTGSQYTLAACAAGSYDDHWRTLATNLVGHHLANTIVRPGWEFNGTWYSWSAKGQLQNFIGCYRHVVNSMRQVPGQLFAFDWNPSLGADAFPAEQAYPGDAYVDYVGVDSYDLSWANYTTSAHGAAAQAKAWKEHVDGDHGLQFWSSYAAAHGKPLAITEWGLTHLANGHGGEDDPSYVGHMFEFMTNPANHVAYEDYFDYGSPTNQHRLTGSTLFPLSAAEFARQIAALH
jgi:Glycosyl hydrolase family 26